MVMSGGSRRHTYLRPLELEPTWAPGQDENRTRGSNRLTTASRSQRGYRLSPVSVGPSSSVASFAFLGGRTLTDSFRLWLSGGNVLWCERDRMEGNASRRDGPDDSRELIRHGDGRAVSPAPSQIGRASGRE